MYCMPANEVTGNFPVRSECIVSVNVNTWVYVLLSMATSAIGAVSSTGSAVVSAKSETNLLVEFCPCLVWSRCPNAVGIVCGGCAVTIAVVRRDSDGK